MIEKKNIENEKSPIDLEHQEAGRKNVLYKPDSKEFSLYWKTGTTVIADPVSEASVRRDESHSIMLDKMLVDMCADKLIPSAFSEFLFKPLIYLTKTYIIIMRDIVCSIKRLN